MNVAAACRVLALLLATLTATGALALAPGFQRMVIAPGCYDLAPGKVLDVPAYCLDQAMAPPPKGAILANAPRSFGAALVKTAAGAALGLKAALEQNLLEVEGSGDDGHVRLKNLTQSPLELCIATPTVIMANGNYASGDLPKLYQRVVQILAPAGAAAEGTGDKDRELHAKRQQALWDMVNEATDRSAEEEAYRALSHRILFGTVDNPEAAGATGATGAAGATGATGAAGATGSAPNRAKCSGQSNGIEICTNN